MFKLLLVCAFFAVAAANPGGLFAAPITQYSTFLAPASSSISKYDTSIIHPTPINYYSAPLAYAHLIKKRSPQLPLAYYGPTTYGAPTTYITSNPSWQSILPAATQFSPALHLIKKRSAPLLSTSYFTPQVYTAASSPILTTSYTSAAAPLFSSSHLIPANVGYTHFIKKRSAALLNTLIAPASYSHQSRFDLQTSHTPLTSISYSSPFVYANNLAYSNLY